jgi:hypothetical protein
MKRIRNMHDSTPGDERPVKFVEERPNVWRVVYADDLSGKA